LADDTKRRMSRRAFLGMGAGLIGAAILLKNDPSCAAPLATATAAAEPAVKHNMWVWRFDIDGAPDGVLENLRRSGLGVVLKTNDGPDWMSRYDDSPTAITGPQKVREMADYFENAGVPFHAWCVVHGLDPIGEARICSDVLNSGARSMVFDLEPSDGSNYWQGPREAALVLGQELRRLQPNARLAVAPDARPWQIDAVPTAEFTTFVNEIQPQSYWRTFEGPTNRRRIAELGHPVGPEGMTPELILDVTVDKLRQFGLPIRPLGQGAANGAEWDRFVRHAYSLQIDSVGVWRYGTTDREVWPTLERLPPPQPPAPEPAPPPAEPAPAAAEPQIAAPEPPAELPPAPAPPVAAVPPANDLPPVTPAEAPAPRRVALTPTDWKGYADALGLGRAEAPGWPQALLEFCD
jgi:hypothetical protein